MNCFSQLYYIIIIYCTARWRMRNKKLVVANSVETHHHHATDFPLGPLLPVPPFMISSLILSSIGPGHLIGMNGCGLHCPKGIVLKALYLLYSFS